MQYRQLGGSGLRVSEICVGTMGFNAKSEEAAVRATHAAIDLGINFIDTADCYGQSEQIVGKALAENGARDKVVLATKGVYTMGDGPNDYGASRYHLINAVEDSLRKLRTDHVDLYILHVVEANTPLLETLRTLDDLVRQGKIRYIGTSKWPVALIVEALGISERCGLERFVSEQPSYNLLDRVCENDLVWACLRHGVSITPFVPLAAGILSGKYRLGDAAPAGSRFARVKTGEGRLSVAALKAAEALAAIAEEKGVAPAELSLAWLLQQPGVTSAILGTVKVEYVESAIRACDVTLTEADLDRIDAIVPPGTHVDGYNFYEAGVWRPMRTGYAKRGGGMGAFIPLNPSGSAAGFPAEPRS